MPLLVCTFTHKYECHLLVLDNCVSKWNLFIDKLGRNVTGQDPYGWVPLVSGILSDQEHCSYRMTRIFLQRSANINTTDSLKQTHPSLCVSIELCETYFDFFTWSYGCITFCYWHIVKSFYAIESPYKYEMLVCKHLYVESFEKNTYTRST